MAAEWRARSAQSNSNKADSIMDVSPPEVLRLLRQYRVTTMIHGHTHRPAAHQLDLDGQAAERLVVGDWGSQAWIARADQQTLVLERLTIAP